MSWLWHSVGWRALSGWWLLTASAPAHDYPHGEARLTHPVALAPAGDRLLALNPTEGRLSVFDLSQPSNAEPRLIREIPVGLEPCSVAWRTADEAWVVNEVSDSVSIVSLSRGLTVETIRTPDEPADVVFASGKAFVTCARDNRIRVFDAASRQELTAISLSGLSPRAMAVSADGGKVYAAFQLSGNGTTVLPADEAPDPPAPTNPALPPAPQTALIVPASDPRIGFIVLDHDVVEIDAASLTVSRYFDAVGTNLFDIAVQPGSGALWVPHTEARNLVRFEPALKGHVVDHRLGRIEVETGGVTAFDLNPSVDFGLLPNVAAQAEALSQPTAAVFSADGGVLWVAAFGSDRVAKISAADGSVLARIDVRIGEPVDSRRMRGPRGLALDAARNRLYTMNMLSHSLTVIDPATATVLAEVPVGSLDPLPEDVKDGRGLLFDARLSGNGLVSCAVCHIDGDRDGLAWDLGDPSGNLTDVTGFDRAVGNPAPMTRTMHPMKGPMVTQTLRGLQRGQLFHWRGDRDGLDDFNATFHDLLGGATLTSEQMVALDLYLHSVRLHPNPNRTLADELPATFEGSDPVRGRSLFNRTVNNCAVCHFGLRGTDNNIDNRILVGSPDHVKTPPLTTTYQRTFFDPTPGGTSLTGFGMGHDGTLRMTALPNAHPYPIAIQAGRDSADVTAYLRCFGTGVAPAIGRTLTVTPATAHDAAVSTELDILESQAGIGAIDLVVQGQVEGRLRACMFDASVGQYRTDNSAVYYAYRWEILDRLTGNDVLSFLGAYPTTGFTRGGDRDLDGTPDADERVPAVVLTFVAGVLRLTWSTRALEWFAEKSDSLNEPWVPAPLSIDRTGAESVGTGLGDGPRQFFRLRRTW